MACDVIWLDPVDCDQPHPSCHADKLATLLEAFRRDGFDRTHPALIGYPLEGRVQLLSGAHRFEAARRLGMKLPVVLWLRSSIEVAWGDLDKWAQVMEAVPVGGVDGL